jgi:hypothetical protein
MSLCTGCQRCGCPVAVEVTLTGGFIAVLCKHCRNDWTQHIRTQPEFFEYGKALARYDFVLALVVGGKAGTFTSPVTEESAMEASDKINKAKQPLFTLGEKFACTPIDRREEDVKEEGTVEDPSPPGPITKQPIGQGYSEDLLADGTRTDEEPPPQDE